MFVSWLNSPNARIRDLGFFEVEHREECEITEPFEASIGDMAFPKDRALSSFWILLKVALQHR